MKYDEKLIKTPCFYRISVKALILNEKQEFLIVQEDNGMWEMPGGGLDHEESPHTALKREIMEEMELGVTWISDSPISFITAKRRDNKHYVANVFYEATLKDLKFTPSEECIDIKFVNSKYVLENEDLFYPNIVEFAKIYSV